MTVIIPLTSTDSGAVSLSTINTNFTALNSGKAEVSGQVFTGAVTATNLSGTNTGDQTNITGNAATVTTNANLTGDVTSVGNAATLATTLTGARNFNGIISINENNNAVVNINTGTSTGQINIGNGASNQSIQVGSGAGIKSIIIGGNVGTSAVQLNAGTAPVSIGSAQPATGSVMNWSNNIGDVNKFITNATPHNAISGASGDVATDITNGLLYFKDANPSALLGWNQAVTESFIRLTSTGSLITTSANFFGASNNTFSLVANAFYEIEIYLYFLKTTAGTVTFTLNNSAAPTSQNIETLLSAATGIAAPPGAATDLRGNYYNDATAARAFTTASLTTAVNHFAGFKVYLRNGAGTTLTVLAAAAAGSITPGIGSYMKLRRLPPIATGSIT